MVNLTSRTLVIWYFFAAAGNQGCSSSQFGQSGTVGAQPLNSPTAANPTEPKVPAMLHEAAKSTDGINSSTDRNLSDGANKQELSDSAEHPADGGQTFSNSGGTEGASGVGTNQTSSSGGNLSSNSSSTANLSSNSSGTASMSSGSSTASMSSNSSGTVTSSAPSLVADGGSNVVHTVAKVGINFEDGGYTGTNSDKDYNDAVLCFEGKFSVDFNKKSITSDAAQSVTATFSRHAACADYMRITVLNAAGKTTFTHDYSTSNGGQSSVTLNFAKGDSLKTYLLAGSGCNNYGKLIGIDDPNWVIVAPDQCRTTGN